jgi:O-antigen/teichoic acid export membrane protein
MQLLSRLPAAFRGVSSIAVGSIVGQGLVMLSYPFLTRLYDAAEFGLLTVFTSVVSILGVVSTLTLHRAVPIPSGDPEAADVAWTALAAVTVTAVLTGAFGVVAAQPVADLLGVPQLARYWWLVAATVFVLGTYFVVSEWMVRDRSYTTLARRNVLQGVGQTATQIGLGMVQVRPVGLLLGLGVGRLCGLGGLLSRGGLLRQRRASAAGVRRTLSRYRRFPQLTLPSALLNSAGLEVPLLLISVFYGDARAGLLGLTVRVIGAPTTFLGQAVDQVFTGESSAAIRDPKGTLVAMLRRTAGWLLLVGVVPTALLLLAAPWLFGLVFGADWTEAGDYARILAVAYLAQFVVNPVSGVLQLLERQGQSLGWAATRLVLTVGGPAVCGMMGAPVAVAIAALSIAHVVSYALMYGLCLRAAKAADDRYRRRLG